MTEPERNTDAPRPRVGISACLLGERVRYDGGHKLDPYLRDELGKLVEWVPVCPEAECGLGVPREAMRLVAREGTVPDPPEAETVPTPRLVTRATGVDHTERMLSWAAKRLDALAREGLAGFVLKARSPSCGMCVEICDAKGKPCGSGRGLWARALAERFPAMPIEEDERLRAPRVRAEFLQCALLHHKEHEGRHQGRQGQKK